VSNQSDNLSIESTITGGVRVVAARGEIDIANAPRFAEALAACAEDATLIVSLDGIQYIDSSGLSVLIRENQARQQRGDRLFIVLPDGNARRVFDVTGLTTELGCFPDLASAVEAAGSDSGGATS
jgi:anti-sigma B factor antagonist